MKSGKFLLVCYFSLIFLLFSSLFPDAMALSEPSIPKIASHSVLPFQDEELRYKVSWSKFVSAGSAVLSLSPDVYNGKTPVLRARAVARSASWMKVLGIDVEDTIESLFDPGYDFSYSFEAKIKETDYKKNKRIIFDWNSHAIEYREREEVSSFELNNLTHDVLSALFYVRTLPLQSKGSFSVNVFDEGKQYLLEVQVIKPDLLTIQDIQIPTLKTKILLKTKGIFNRKGDVYIWFSDDVRRMPVQMQCNIFLGFFHVELVNPKAFFYYR